MFGYWLYTYVFLTVTIVMKSKLRVYHRKPTVVCRRSKRGGRTCKKVHSPSLSCRRAQLLVEIDGKVFRKGRRIGKGSSGSVYQFDAGSDSIAVKVQRYREDSATNERLIVETLLPTLNSNFLTHSREFIQLCDNHLSPAICAKENDDIMTVMPRFQNTVQWFWTQESFDQSQILRIVNHVTIALNALALAGVIYTDVKTSNLMFHHS